LKPTIITPTEPLVKSMPVQEYKAYQEPPLQLMEAMGYKDKPTNLTYNMLYQMSIKNSVVGAVINTRVNQVSTFTQPSRFSEDGLGYKIRLRDPNAVPTEGQQEVIASIESFIENCGYKKDNARDNFDTFIRKIVRDSLTYDQSTFEVIRDRAGRPAEFMAVDAATIRAATEDFKYSQYMGDNQPKSNEEVSYVQVVDGVVVAWFTAEELAFGIRNPRSSIYMQPYGFSELEQLVTQITSHLYAEEYNSKFFSQGGTTKGIINIKQDPNGVMNTEQLESFKRQWRAQVSGLTGAWKTPVLQVPNGIEYINVSQSNREMEFEKWMNYLINIVCAVFQIDPAEVNFPNNGGVGGTGGGVFESSNETRIKHSKDKGLRPLLRFVESMMNKHLISQFSDAYVFTFAGIDEESENDKVELATKEVKTYKTINEIRKERGYDELENGDVLLDPSWLNYVNQKAMSAGMGGGMMGEEETEPSQGENENESVMDTNTEGADNGFSEYSGYETEEEPTEEVGTDYSGYSDYGMEKSLSKLIITIDD
jgi:HK97 family phage portal protein